MEVALDVDERFLQDAGRGRARDVAGDDVLAFKLHVGVAGLVEDTAALLIRDVS